MLPTNGISAAIVARAAGDSLGPLGGASEDHWPSAFAWTGRHKPEEYLRDRACCLWEAREQGDFVLEARDESFRVHGCMLAAASPVFRAMLSSEMIESQQRSAKVDADPQDVVAMVRFAYMGELGELQPLQLPGVLQLAHKYEMVELIPLCCDAMVRNLSADTAVPFVRALRLLEGVPMDLSGASSMFQHAAQPAKEMGNGIVSLTLTPQVVQQQQQQQPSLPAAAQQLQAQAQPQGQGQPQAHGQGQLQAQAAAGVTSLFGAPPEQPQQANVASLFRDSSEHPRQPQLSNASGFFGTQHVHPQQPATSLQPQLLTRASAASGSSSADVAQPTPESKSDVPEVCIPAASPIAHTFVTIARLIAESPHLQMATLRGL